VSDTADLQISPARRRLARRLADLRASADLSQESLAERLGKVQGTVSKWERAASVPSSEDARAWALACGAASDTDELLDLVHEALTETATLRAERRSEMARTQRRYRQLESEVSVLRNYQQLVVPGMLQTAAYATAIFSYGGEGGDVAEAVRERMQRQDLLYAGRQRLEFLIGEEALRRRVAQPQVLAGQLDRLASLLELGNVSIAVLPLAEPPVDIAAHSFIVFGDREVDEVAWVHVSLFTDHWTTQDPNKVRVFTDLFVKMSQHALRGRQARDLLERIAAEMFSA